MSEDEARREVRREVDARGGRGAFAKQAKIDPGTLGDFLDGIRWPHAKTRTKVEQALGWPAGRIEDLREGVAAVTSVEDAIRADPELLPEARDHLLNQVRLLRRLQSALAPTDLAERRVRGQMREALGEIDLVTPSEPEEPPAEDAGRRGRPGSQGADR
jgi:hypothetical protein